MSEEIGISPFGLEEWDKERKEAPKEKTPFQISRTLIVNLSDDQIETYLRHKKAGTVYAPKEI